ncbi:collagen binding domain-containing protein [Gorillibacterium massiliense]|uniref:collagen binding domain-containing protein n=1 Tax=Gorillibacterium massiliense TaxID=1280390 RepID=UPI00059298CC|nr:collagen binding domain-containing protein [Gorillibacterium massiliense]
MRLKNKRRRTISMVLIMLLIVTSINGIFPGILPWVHADGVRPLSATEASVTIDKLLINGKEVKDNTPIGEPIGQTSDVSLFYNWSIDDSVGINDGDYIEVAVPDGFRIGNDAHGDLVNDGDSVGIWTLTKNTRMLRLTFNEFAKTALQVHGTVQIDTRFELATIQRTNPVSFIFPISGAATKTFTIKFAPNNVSKAVEKFPGQPNKTMNADKIKWTVDINKTLATVSNGTVTDTFDAKLNPDPSSFHLYKLDVDLDGNVSLGTEITPQPVPVVNAATNQFTVDLGNLDSAVRLVYDTAITDPSKTSFTNKADFNGASSTATAGVTRGSSLEKKGAVDRAFNPTKITWTVYANKAESSLTDAVITDTLPTDLTLNTADVSVYELTLNNDGSVNTETLVPPNSLNSLDFTNHVLTVGLGTTSKAYKIVYTTPIDVASTKSSFKNSAEMSDGATKVGNAADTVSFKIGTPLTKSGAASIDYTDKHINWTVDVNTGQKSIVGAHLVDTIAAGHKLDTSSVKIYPLTFDNNGNPTKGAEVTSSYTVNKTASSIDVDFGNITSAFRIEYTTTITDVNKNNGAGFDNSVNLKGTGAGIGTGGVTKNWNVNPGIANSVDKTTTGIDYSA